MSRAQRWRRLNHIRRVISRYRLREFLKPDQPSRDPRPRGERLRLALEELGPVFVKFGQALSTRPDIVPPDIASELARLQDRVRPFAGSTARAIIEEELGQPVEDLFAEFDEVPLASASVAQVHAARLKDGDDGSPGVNVVVKVLRPGIEQTMVDDIALLHTLARWAERFVPLARRVRAREVAREYEKVLLDELDLMREGANAALLRRNWLGSELIYHPQVFWQFTRTRVLVLERIYGLSIRELDKLRELGVDFEALSERGVEIFFKQTFVYNFFHADMHPGNIFVDPSDPKRPRYLAVDFGIVGQLTPQDQRYLAENFYAFFNRDYRRIAELHLESQWIPEGTRVEEFEGAIRTICEPIFQRPLREISFGFFLLRLFQIARRFNYQVQPQLVLLQKTLLQVEGLGRQLNPDLDLWKTAKPIMEDWMRRRLSPAAAFEQVRRNLPMLAEALPQLTKQLVSVARNEQPEKRWGAQLQALQQQQQRAHNRQLKMIGAGALGICASLIYLGGKGALLLGVPVLSWGLGGAALLLGARALFANSSE
ncbi:ubiquinone biosynthesis regulatory protein kinase UbiB [Sinimarinibacterium sp. NLF-5-8]|uniref:ubiquinone biosynthesis regulatory protein kinase UbiB n=1 Tax=Sinimarinibacterium sp. NLF-5-8 TaxID=2698684 RepID=UPI00137C040E|nr:ubiquinone biosynthesis regulatory protein kinase UbiB [Sinimarinibacterium sp. NLF-5-8]QHS10490.1 ubiquinone biosynthesis regulatory protein kinase UbiB [Sinimarinibacterium sp. NLF-5-8]